MIRDDSLSYNFTLCLTVCLVYSCLFQGLMWAWSERIINDRMGGFLMVGIAIVSLGWWGLWYLHQINNFSDSPKFPVFNNFKRLSLPMLVLFSGALGALLGTLL